MIRSIQKFFASPWKAPKIEKRTEIGLDEFFRTDPSKKPRVAPMVQKPSYELPETSDYASWCRDRINDKIKSHQKFSHPDRNGAHVVDFYKASGMHTGS